MKIIQVQLDENERYGVHGGYFNYEFGIVSKRIHTNPNRVYVDFGIDPDEEVYTDEDGDIVDNEPRTQYGIATSECKVIGEIE